MSVYAKAREQITDPHIRWRFERGFDQVEGEGCWEWKLSYNTGGYGQFCPYANRPMGAHRVSYLIYVGPIPRNQYVRHRCDNKRCVRPDHLILGKPVKNTHDMLERGRGMVTLSLAVIQAVYRDVTTTDEPIKRIAERYGVSRKNVARIAKRDIDFCTEGRIEWQIGLMKLPQQLSSTL